MAITINGKEYDESKFSDKLKNYIIARQEIQNNKTRLLIDCLLYTSDAADE